MSWYAQRATKHTVIFSDISFAFGNFGYTYFGVDGPIRTGANLLNINFQVDSTYQIRIQWNGGTRVMYTQLDFGYDFKYVAVECNPLTGILLVFFDGLRIFDSTNYFRIPPIIGGRFAFGGEMSFLIDMNAFIDDLSLC
jgi:hypothetical protein